MERLLIIFLVLVALNLSAIFIILQGRGEETLATTAPTLLLTVDSAPLVVTIADSAEERSRGLSGRPFLSENEGLFFIFPEAGNWGFWMKDMNFSIDIIWLDDDFTITTIEREVAPESYPTIFYPATPSRYVVETQAGFTRLHGVEVGEKVSLRPAD